MVTTKTLVDENTKAEITLEIRRENDLDFIVETWDNNGDAGIGITGKNLSYVGLLSLAKVADQMIGLDISAACMELYNVG